MIGRLGYILGLFGVLLLLAAIILPAPVYAIVVFEDGFDGYGDPSNLQPNWAVTSRGLDYAKVVYDSSDPPPGHGNLLMLDQQNPGGYVELTKQISPVQGQAEIEFYDRGPGTPEAFLFSVLGGNKYVGLGLNTAAFGNYYYRVGTTGIDTGVPRSGPAYHKLILNVNSEGAWAQLDGTSFKNLGSDPGITKIDKITLEGLDWVGTHRLTYFDKVKITTAQPPTASFSSPSTNPDGSLTVTLGTTIPFVANITNGQSGFIWLTKGDGHTDFNCNSNFPNRVYDTPLGNHTSAWGKYLWCEVAAGGATINGSYTFNELGTYLVTVDAETRPDWKNNGLPTDNCTGGTTSYGFDPKVSSFCGQGSNLTITVNSALTATPVPTGTPVPTNTPTPLLCDFNGNKAYDDNDFDVWKNSFLTPGSTTADCAGSGDNPDGKVDLIDFNYWRTLKLLKSWI